MIIETSVEITFLTKLLIFNELQIKVALQTQ